jgi:Cu-processing system ATP-binding protein
MIRIEGLTKRFGPLEVLRGIDLTIVAGRVTAIIGPNGAGKTTLIKILLGLARPDRGTLMIDGQPVGDDPAYRARIGYMPQIARFPQNLTGTELLAMLRDLRGGSRATDEELIHRFALAPELAKPLRTLSGGNRQKVNAAAAFLFDPDLIVLDEPTAGLDPVSSGILKDKVRSARAEGKSFILTTHIMSEIDELADDVVLLLDGQVRFAGPVHDLKVRTRQLNLERAIAQLMLHTEAA